MVAIATNQTNISQMEITLTIQIVPLLHHQIPQVVLHHLVAVLIATVIIARNLDIVLVNAKN